MSQWILGIRADFDGLRIEPCLPGSMRELRITRVFRGCTYRIHVYNSGRPMGEQVLTVDGKPFASNVVPPGVLGSTIEVAAET